MEQGQWIAPSKTKVIGALPDRIATLNTGCCNALSIPWNEVMIKTYSQRLSPPYSGQAQIAESEGARAVTLDSENWEFHFLQPIKEGELPGNPHYKKKFLRVAYIQHSQLARIAREGTYEGRPIDDRIVELAAFLAEVKLPFPQVDNYEYWLLDAKDGSPLAFIFSCTESEQMANFPVRPEWTALPAAQMPIDKTEAEKACGEPPVNYRLERLVAERAGSKPKARWFHRHADEADSFPPLLLREDWQDEQHYGLCQRYIQRQSTRLLMLHGLEQQDRLRMEQASRSHTLEVARFYPLYPEVADRELMNAIRVEARMRGLTDEQESPVNNRRDGVLYI